jgi:hypothetical protein
MHECVRWHRQSGQQSVSAQYADMSVRCTAWSGDVHGMFRSRVPPMICHCRCSRAVQIWHAVSDRTAMQRSGKVAAIFGVLNMATIHPCGFSDSQCPCGYG